MSESETREGLFIHSQVVVRVRHVGPVSERLLERDLCLLHSTPLGQHVGQISISCKKWQRMRESLNKGLRETGAPNPNSGHH